MSKGICFVICPIGEPGSDIRARADLILDYIIKPVVDAMDYECLRADQIDKPGLITRQVIQHLIEDPLVIADLTGPNANVFYELAIRHMVQKPIVQLIQIGEKLPFDVLGQRTIGLDTRIDTAVKAQEDLKKQIEAVEKDPKQVDNPVSHAWNFMGLAKSENPQDQLVTSLVDRMKSLEDQLDVMHGKIDRMVLPLPLPPATGLFRATATSVPSVGASALRTYARASYVEGGGCLAYLFY